MAKVEGKKDIKFYLELNDEEMVYLTSILGAMSEEDFKLRFRSSHTRQDLGYSEDISKNHYSLFKQFNNVVREVLE